MQGSAYEKGKSNKQLILVATFVILAKFVFAMYVGLFVTPDSVGYKSIANALVVQGPSVLLEPVNLEIRQRSVLEGESWHEFAPLLAFRAIGYPLFIAAAKTAAPTKWIATILGVQALLSVLICFLIYHLLRTFRFSPSLSLGVALLYGVSPIIDLDQCLLTDSIYASSIAAFALLLGLGISRGVEPTLVKAFGLGTILATALTMREATQYLAFAAVPLVAAWTLRSRKSFVRRLALTVAVFIPMILTIAIYWQWNSYRTGHRFITTLTQVSALVPIFSAELLRIDRDPTSASTFDSGSPLDVVGRELIRSAQLQREKTGKVPTQVQLATEMNHRLAERYGMDSLKIAQMASSKFLTLWLSNPMVMLRPVPARVVASVTVLRPLDLRFISDPPPADVTLLSAKTGRPKGARVGQMDRFGASVTKSRAATFVHALSFVGKVASAIMIGAYLVLSLWLLIRTTSSALRHQEIVCDASELLLVGFACIFWAFLLLHAAIHMESRYMQPIAPLVLVSLALLVRRSLIGVRSDALRAS